VALAPNLFSRWKATRRCCEAAKSAWCCRSRVAAVIDAALDFLKSHPRVAPERIALMGVCQSGRYPIVIGSRRRDLAAFVVLYGGSRSGLRCPDLQPQPMREMMPLASAPVLFVYGERDHTDPLADVRARAMPWRTAAAATNEGGSGHAARLDERHHAGALPAQGGGRSWGVLLAFPAMFSEAIGRQGQVRWEFESATPANYDFSKNVS